MAKAIRLLPVVWESNISLVLAHVTQLTRENGVSPQLTLSILTEAWF